MEIDKEISKHNLSAFGWGLDDYKHSTPFTSHVIYIRDFRNGGLRLFTLSQKEFNELKVNEKVSIGDCVNFIGLFMRRLSENKKISDLEIQALAPTLCNYIKLSKTYAEWRKRASYDTRLHLVMNIYKSSESVDPDAISLRPFVLFPESVMLTAQEVLQYTDQVKMSDKERHPEWFR